MSFVGTSLRLSTMMVKLDPFIGILLSNQLWLKNGLIGLMGGCVGHPEGLIWQQCILWVLFYGAVRSSKESVVFPIQVSKQ